jgi:Methyltransferase domain
MELATFVYAQLPPTPARVLEIGCGGGDLARAVARRGYEIVAIDPLAPEGEIFEPVSLEEFTGCGPFDAVLANSGPPITPGCTDTPSCGRRWTSASRSALLLDAISLRRAGRRAGRAGGALPDRGRKDPRDRLQLRRRDVKRAARLSVRCRVCVGSKAGSAEPRSRSARSPRCRSRPA